MKKSLIAGTVMAVILAITFCFFYLATYGFHTISTDKKVYAAGEEINITSSTVFLQLNSCDYWPDLQTYQKTALGWKRINEEYEKNKYSVKCVNSNLINVGLMGPDYCGSTFRLITFHGTYGRHINIAEFKGRTGSCGNETLPKYMYEVDNFESAPAPPGTYMLKLADAEAVFDIK